MSFARRFAFVPSLASLLRIPYVVVVTPGYYMSGFRDRKRSFTSPNRKHSKADGEPNNHKYRMRSLARQPESPLEMATQSHTDPRQPRSLADMTTRLLTALHSESRSVYSRLRLSHEVVAEDRWYRHAEMVVCSIFCAHEDEDYYSWTARAIDAEWHKDSHDYSIDIVVSKIRTALETNGKNTPVVHIIRLLVWLGLLTQCWHEAEVCIHLHVNKVITVADVRIATQMAGLSRVPAVSMPRRHG